MAAFVSDVFTDTTGVRVAAHVGGTGATWTTHPSYVDAMVITSNRCRKDGTTSTPGYYASGVPASADYRVSCDVFIASTLTGASFFVAGRMDTSANTMYLAAINPSGNIGLTKIVAGTSTSLGLKVVTLNANETHNIELVMVGSRIQMAYDGVVQFDVIDTAITAAGRAGIRGSATAQASNTGSQGDNFVAQDIVPVAATVNGTGTQSGGVTVARPLAASVSAAGTNTADAAVARPLAAASTGTGSTSAETSVARPLQGQSDGAGSTTATAHLLIPLGGGSTGQGDNAADVVLTVALAVEADGVSDVAGLLSFLAVLQGAAAGSSTATGTVRLGRWRTGTPEPWPAATGGRWPADTDAAWAATAGENWPGSTSDRW